MPRFLHENQAALQPCLAQGREMAFCEVDVVTGPFFLKAKDTLLITPFKTFFQPDVPYR